MSLSLNDLPLVTRELNSVRDDWYKIGLGLELDEAFLRGIKYESRIESGACLKKMLSKYLRDSSAHWDNVVKALEKAGNKDIAHQIKSSFLTSKEPVLDGSKGDTREDGIGEKTLTEEDVGEILEILISCSAKWKLIGTLLGIKQGILSTFESNPLNFATAPTSYFLEMLTYWTNNMSGTTVNALVGALRVLGESRLAEELLQKNFI